MKTIKVIDLLNRIANNEEVPKKIQYSGCIYERLERFDNKYSYKNCDGCYIEDDFYLINILNDEVKIIEDTPKEDNKIKNIPYTFDLNFVYCNINETAKEGINKTINDIINKINEIIDKVNSEDNE